MGAERRPLFLHQDSVQGRRQRQPHRRLRPQGQGRLRRRAQRHCIATEVTENEIDELSIVDWR